MAKNGSRGGRYEDHDGDYPEGYTGEYAALLFSYCLSIILNNRLREIFSCL